MVLANSQASVGCFDPFGSAHACPLAYVSGWPCRSVNGAIVTSASGELLAMVLTYQESIGIAPTWSLAYSFFAPKKSQLSRNALNFAGAAWLVTSPAANFS